RDQQAEQYRAGMKLVNFNMRFADAEIVSFVHGRLSEGVAALAAEVGCEVGFPGALAGAAELLLARGAGSCFRTTGSVVSSTITSSSFSRFAEGFTRICL